MERRGQERKGEKGRRKRKGGEGKPLKIFERRRDIEAIFRGKEFTGAS